MSVTYEWVGGGGNVEFTPQETHDIQLAVEVNETFTFERAIVTFELIHKWTGDDISELPVWAPVVAAVYWRGMSSDLAPRALFDAGGDYSEYQGVQWTTDFEATGPGIASVFYRGLPAQGIMDVRGARRLIRYTDPSNILWLSIGHTQAGTIPPDFQLRSFTAAWTARILYSHP